MTDPIPLSEVPDDIGRNDPCPCGSGKKYKKCCYRLHQVQREAAKKSRTVDELVDAETTPFDMFDLFVQIGDNNILPLFWEMAHDAGPWRAKYPAKEDFLSAIGQGDERPVAAQGHEVLRIRHDGPDCRMLLVRNRNASHGNVGVEIVTLRRNETGDDGARRDVEHPGWRVWDVDRQQISRDAFDESAPLTFEGLGVAWSHA